VQRRHVVCVRRVHGRAVAQQHVHDVHVAEHRGRGQGREARGGVDGVCAHGGQQGGDRFGVARAHRGEESGGGGGRGRGRRVPTGGLAGGLAYVCLER